MEPLRVKLLSEHAKAPTRASAGAAGYDLYAAENAEIWSVPTVVKTNVAVAIPPTHYGRVCSRSGLSAKHGIEVGAGVIDSDYRGDIGVVLYNHSPRLLKVKKGDRIAQLVLHRIDTPDVVVVTDLETTTRGAGGFGSTGSQ